MSVVTEFMASNSFWMSWYGACKHFGLLVLVSSQLSRLFLHLACNFLRYPFYLIRVHIDFSSYSKHMTRHGKK